MLYFKAMLNSKGFYKGVFLHVTPVRIIVPWYIQRTLMNSILLILCFCFALHCSSLWCLFCKCTTFFLPCVVFKAEMPLTVFHCHTILIENVCRLLCKSMLPTMFIKMCVKLKHIHLASYVEVEKLTSKVNAALW